MAGADAITQDVFVRAWENLGAFREECPRGAWLHRIAVRQLMMHPRTTARRLRRIESVVATVDENVRIVDDAITAARAALEEPPEDAELRADRDRAEQDKLDILRAATELGR